MGELKSYLKNERWLLTNFQKHAIFMTVRRDVNGNTAGMRTAS